MSNISRFERHSIWEPLVSQPSSPLEQVTASSHASTTTHLMLTRIASNFCSKNFHSSHSVMTHTLVASASLVTTTPNVVSPTLMPKFKDKCCHWCQPPSIIASLFINLQPGFDFLNFANFSQTPFPIAHPQAVQAQGNPNLGNSGNGANTATAIHH